DRGPRGGLSLGAMAPAVRERVEARLPGFGDEAVVSQGLWSGYEYGRMVTGTWDFLLYWRTWPWDHAPGAVLLREVGGVSRRLDGSEYRPAGRGEGLLVARAPEVFDDVRERLGLAD